jgi:hypothetical protein
MRGMKVRGYSLDEGQWIKGFGAEYNDDLETYLVHNYRGFFEVDGESIGEYTGYKDINDIEICEGDIVETGKLKNDGIKCHIDICYYNSVNKISFNNYFT